MKKLITLLVFVSAIAQAQYSVKGTMSPPDKNDWVILYKIEGAKQRFVKNTNTKIDTVKVEGKEQRIGTFGFTLPADAKPGVYRITYRQKGADFIDFIFNKEDVEFIFNPEFPTQTVQYSSSKENKVYREYLEANGITQRTLDSIQVEKIKDPSKHLDKYYRKALNKLSEVQEIYTKKSVGMLASHFIQASQRQNSPVLFETMQSYLDSILDNFFNNIDFNSKELYNSSFLMDRITDYVFYLNFSTEKELQQKLFKESITKVMAKISDAKLKKETSEFLISQFTKKENATLVDYIFNNYYNKLPAALQNEKFRRQKLGVLQAAIGRHAPDFSWRENDKNYTLSGLKDGKNYLLVFWSTSCSHCIKEVPKLYKFMKTQPDTKVVTYAIERHDFDWYEYKGKFTEWHNVMALNPEDKWDNKLVTEVYQVHATPSYFILDENKKIVAKPNEYTDVVKYFSNLKKDAKAPVLDKK